MLAGVYSGMLLWAGAGLALVGAIAASLLISRRYGTSAAAEPRHGLTPAPAPA